MEDWKAKQAARASAAAALQVAFPYLVAAGPKCDSLNAAAKNIRIELKAAFPAVKFSVKSSRYSGGDSISVRWVDGPVCAQVDEIINKYKAGSFNGMDDSYEYSHDAWNDAFGDAKYVFSNREDSDAAVASCIRTVKAKYGANLAEVGAPEPSLEGYKRGDYRSLQVLGGCYGDLLSLIQYELSRRVWVLAKRPAKAEEVAA